MPKKAEMQIMNLWCMEMMIKMCQECHLAKTAAPDTPEKNFIIFLFEYHLYGGKSCCYLVDDGSVGLYRSADGSW